MSSQTISQAFAQVEQRYRCAMIEAAWGHLAPRKNKSYPGMLIWAVGCFSQDTINPTVLVSDFRDLDDSPWYYQAAQEFVRQYSGNQPGGVYRFDGIFKNYEFIGSVNQLRRYPDQLDPFGDLAYYLQARGQEGDEENAPEFLERMLTAGSVQLCVNYDYRSMYEVCRIQDEPDE